MKKATFISALVIVLSAMSSCSKCGECVRYRHPWPNNGQQRTFIEKRKVCGEGEMKAFELDKREEIDYNGQRTAYLIWECPID